VSVDGPCATGCRLAGMHLETCETDRCRGCQPRPAAEGTLCDWCYQQLTRAVRDIPELVAHLTVVAIGATHASLNPLTDDVRAPGDPAESTVLHAATLDADELLSFLDSWAHVVMEEHPNQPMRGPSASPWHGDVSAWISPHLPWIAQQDWAFEMRRDLCDTIATIRHKHPTVDDVEPIKHLDTPCPRCGLISLIYTPPRYATQAFRVECTDPDCTRVFSEDEWERFKALALDARHGKVAA
jgi:hypothetical protein